MNMLFDVIFSSGIVFVLVVVGIVVFLNFVPLGLWISAIAAGVNVGIFNLIGMRLRRVPASQIVLPLIKANKAGLDVNVNQLEAHYLAGGNVDRVIDALIAAHRAQIDLSFERGCAIDLAGRNVLEAVQMSVNPEVIETPVVSAVAKDGIELKVKARVTVRANIDRLVGGAGEATIIARVGEGIVTNVGSSDDHSKVLENPDYISKTVLDKGLDAGTAFEILSIDIADVDVGRNIGAALMTDQAEADKRIAQARAEERRAMAVAKEQEMKAYTQEMQAKVVEAQAKVPAAMAAALESGRLGVMDYYRLNNIQADTQMRRTIAEVSPDAVEGAGKPDGK
ncbi:MAG: flotillin-like protein FloA [Phascolarctobacterium sp.]|uniref:flotillin-like protein FloA n=1 Tax=Phascolarctobacterium sp. TaxID=2049039 RepID=UPI0026DDA31C|nr:flotillin-like protein FloA [Phascolarctobacterium sp.]MDO4922399.1 flotillin-like protein FloA [Phascolarctobacterium sp.]